MSQLQYQSHNHSSGASSRSNKDPINNSQANNNTQHNKLPLNSTSSSTSSRNNQSNQAQQHNSSSAFSQKTNSNSIFATSQSKIKDPLNYQNKNEEGALQFRVLSKSPGKGRNQNNYDYSQRFSSSNSQNPHHYENVYDVMGKPNQAHKISQIIMNDSADIFNDWIDGGGVEPSINESIRQSIQCSFVSSECNETKQKYQAMEHQPSVEAQRAQCVMNRMNWITYLKVLFDQLDSFNSNKLKHVESENFLTGLKKIKHILPLQSRNEYTKNSSEIAFSYKEVESVISQMPEYITWDNIIDVFLLSIRNQSRATDFKSTNNIKTQREMFTSSIGSNGEKELNSQRDSKLPDGSNQFRMNNLFQSQRSDGSDKINFNQQPLSQNNARLYVQDERQQSLNNFQNSDSINQMNIHHQSQPNHNEESQVVSEVDYDNEGEETSNHFQKQEYIQVHRSLNNQFKSDEDEDDDGFPITQIEQDKFIDLGQNSSQVKQISALTYLSHQRHQRGMSSMGGEVRVVQTSSLISNGAGLGQFHQRNLSKPNVISQNPISSSFIQKTLTGTQVMNTANMMNSHLTVNYGGSSVENQSKNNKQRHEDFYPSFADSLINYGNGSMVQGISHLQHNQTNQSLMAGDQPFRYGDSSNQNNCLIKANEFQDNTTKFNGQPLFGYDKNLLTDRANNEDDEACEIESEYSRPEDENEDQNNSRGGMNHIDRKILEDSVRSSRTATFKNMRRTSQAQNENHYQNQSIGQMMNLSSSIQASQNFIITSSGQNQVTNAMVQAVNVQDSYYSTVKSNQGQHSYGQRQSNSNNNLSLSNHIHNQSREQKDQNVNQNQHKNSKSINQSMNSQNYYNTQTGGNKHQLNQSNSQSNNQNPDSRQSSTSSRVSNLNSQNYSRSQAHQEEHIELGSNQSFGSSRFSNKNSNSNYSSVKVDQNENYEDLSKAHAANKGSLHKGNFKSQVNNPHQIQAFANQNGQNQYDVYQKQPNTSKNMNAGKIHLSSQSSESNQGKRQSNQNQGQQQNYQSQISQFQDASNSQTSYSSQSNQSISVTKNSNHVDLDYSKKNLKNFDLQQARQNIPNNFDKLRIPIRSLNLGLNSLVKLPTPLEKSLIYMNFSYNNLKSLNGIETCVNLKFLNVTGNQISSASNLAFLQSMRELIFSQNQLSLLKDIAQLKNLRLLDLSNNKITQIEQVSQLQGCKKLSILSLQGNVIEKSPNYEFILKRYLPQVKVQDPDMIKDYSQFSDMENICFTEPEAPGNNNESELINVEINRYDNLRQTAISEQEIESATHQENQVLGNQAENKQRSKTPNRERAKSYLGGGADDSEKIDYKRQLNNFNELQQNQKLKQAIISPGRNAQAGIFQSDGANKRRVSNIGQVSQLQKSPLDKGQMRAVQNQNALKLNSSPLVQERQAQNRSNLRNNDGGAFYQTQELQSQRISKNAEQAPNSHRGLDKNYLKNDRSVNEDRRKSNLIMGQKEKSQTRLTGERSTSNLSRNDPTRQNYSSQNQPVKQTTSLVKNKGFLNNFSQVSHESGSNYIKKISINSQASYQPASMQGKITPRRAAFNSNQPFASGLTPRQDKSLHQQKKSFCQVNEISNYNLQNPNTTGEAQSFTPSKTEHPSQIQDSARKKFNQVTKIVKKDISSLNSARQKILSPTTVARPSQIQSNQPQSVKNSTKPVTNLKQRLTNGASSLSEVSQELNMDLQGKRITNLTASQAINVSQLHEIKVPQSTKDVSLQSKSFIFDQNQGVSNRGIQEGRATPTSNMNQMSSSQNIAYSQQKPMASQLQKFIMGSQRPNTSQQMMQATSSRPQTSQTQLSIHQSNHQMQIPSQKLTNLPPKSYQLRSGNPGDKKTKADMSLSVLQGNQNNSINISQTQLNEASHQAQNFQPKGHQEISQPIKRLGKDSPNEEISKSQNKSFQNKEQDHQNLIINQKNSQVNISQSQNPLSLLMNNTSASNSQINFQQSNVSALTSIHNQSSQLNQLQNFSYLNNIKMTDDSNPHQFELLRDTYDQSRRYDTMTPDCNIDCITERSISPVLEESNNIKKLKVDLTQYMNKQ